MEHTLTCLNDPETSKKNRNRKELSQNSSFSDNMLRTITVVQQDKNKFKGAERQEDRSMIITKIVLFIMKQNGQ